MIKKPSLISIVIVQENHQETILKSIFTCKGLAKLANIASHISVS